MSDYERGYGAWHNIDASCVHCHKRLKARWHYSHGQSWILQGAYPVDVAHQDGSTHCTITYKAECYDIWTANRELKAKEAELAELGEKKGER